MNLTDLQLRTLEEIERAGRAERLWRTRSRKHDDWGWMVAGTPRSGTVDRLLAAGCLALNDNNSDAAELTEFGRDVLRLRSQGISR